MYFLTISLKNNAQQNLQHCLIFKDKKYAQNMFLNIMQDVKDVRGIFCHDSYGHEVYFHSNDLISAYLADIALDKKATTDLDAFGGVENVLHN